ncbi:thioredoxin-like protein [Aaosphaeria arxii CBS 175.79]|uniref:Thioredoxin-like protein n=1 Tax=Aaosphaeria arxii CBS 175.79 TaxID=1450172 RepID=A0A6A5XFC7_9PLEO|nr:thioredoxin-like protein [Aaosphaeria arxii CBS 175.79]KAF2011527.1 thioredoxin-like protein [Aaosphaeria arxii CBS 175.79]
MPSEISSQLHFRTLLTGHEYLVADFYATWCPPCKQIAPIYETLSAANSIPGKLAFVKINVDEQQEVARPYAIQSIPTFIVFKDGKPIDTIKGANPPALKRIVERIAGEVRSAEAARAKAKPKVQETNCAEVKDEKTVSGSYGMTGGNNWKMSLN